MRKRQYCLLLGLMLLLLAAGIYISKDYRLEQYKGSLGSEANWNLTVKETGDSQKISLPYSLEYEDDYTYILTTKISYRPRDTDSPALFLTMNHSYFKVFLDNSEIYSYTKDGTPGYSKSPGNVYTSVALPRDCTGKTLRIEFKLALDGGFTYALSDIFTGDYGSIMHSIFVNDIFHNCMIVCMLFIGIMLIILSVFVLKPPLNRDTCYLSFFALLFALYSFSESQFILYMLGNPFLSYLINFIVFAAIPIPILVFYKNKVASAFRLFYNMGVALLALNIGLQLILHFSGIADIRQMLLATHLMYLFVFLLIFISIIKTEKQYCQKKSFFIGLLVPIVIGGIIDAVVHYLLTGSESSNTKFSHMGVLVTLLIASGYAVRNIILAMQENSQAKFYKELAFKDGLTSVYNRTAYNDEIASLSRNLDACEDLICVCVDIDGLKQINDTYGHLIGDNMILQTAAFLSEFFGEYGKVFRIGGDEFSVFLHHLDESALHVLMRKMENHINKYNRKAQPKLTFSMGYEVFRNIDNRDISECIRHADKKMYDEKARQKAKR